MTLSPPYQGICGCSIRHYGFPSFCWLKSPKTSNMHCELSTVTRSKIKQSFMEEITSPVLSSNELRSCLKCSLNITSIGLYVVITAIQPPSAMTNCISVLTYARQKKIIVLSFPLVVRRSLRQYRVMYLLYPYYVSSHSREKLRLSNKLQNATYQQTAVR